MATALPKGEYEKIINLALKGYTAKSISEKLKLEINLVSEAMPTDEERQDIRASQFGTSEFGK